MQIVAMGGGGFSMPPGNPALDDYVLSLVPHKRPRVLLLPTASGDAAHLIVRFYESLGRRSDVTHLSLFRRTVEDLEGALRAADVVYVTGGNTANMLAVWRLHGVDAALRNAAEDGTILCGLSAGSLCWFETGITDSFGRDLHQLEGALGWIAGSHCPHYHSESQRRPRYHECIAAGMPAGLALDDGAAAHFVDGKLTRLVSSSAGAGAYRVERHEHGVVESQLSVDRLE